MLLSRHCSLLARVLRAWSSEPDAASRHPHHARTPQSSHSGLLDVHPSSARPLTSLCPASDSTLACAAMLQQPRLPPTGQRQAIEVHIKWREVLAQKQSYLGILSEATGNSPEKLDQVRPCSCVPGCADLDAVGWGPAPCPVIEHACPVVEDA